MSPLHGDWQDLRLVRYGKVDYLGRVSSGISLGSGLGKAVS